MGLFLQPYELVASYPNTVISYRIVITKNEINDDSHIPADVFVAISCISQRIPGWNLEIWKDRVFTNSYLITIHDHHPTLHNLCALCRKVMYGAIICWHCEGVID
jgi:hypothetical protein